MNETKDKFSAFSFAMKLFQAQSLLGYVSLTIPFDKSFDILRERLFEASMAILQCSTTLEVLTGKED